MPAPGSSSTICVLWPTSSKSTIPPGSRTTSSPSGPSGSSRRWTPSTPARASVLRPTPPDASKMLPYRSGLFALSRGGSRILGEKNGLYFAAGQTSRQPCRATHSTSSLLHPSILQAGMAQAGNQATSQRDGGHTPSLCRCIRPMASINSDFCSTGQDMDLMFSITVCAWTAATCLESAACISGPAG